MNRPNAYERYARRGDWRKSLPAAEAYQARTAEQRCKPHPRIKSNRRKTHRRSR